MVPLFLSFYLTNIKLRKEEQELKSISDYAQKKLQKIKSGEVAFLESDECFSESAKLDTTDTATALQHMLREAFLNGIVVSKGLNEVKEQTNLCWKFLVEKRQIIVAFFVHNIIGLILAFLARFLICHLNGIGVSGLLGLDDAISITIAASSCFIFFYILGLAVPKNWVCLTANRLEIRDWLSALFLFQVSNNFPVATDLQQLAKKELLQGISLKNEYFEILNEYGFNRALNQNNRLKTINELLPVFDLLTVGITSFLVLVVPILSLI